MKTTKLKALLITLIMSTTPSMLLAQNSATGAGQGTANTSNTMNSGTEGTDINRTSQGDINPSLSERNNPDINNVNANDNLSNPTNNTDGAIVERNNIRGMNNSTAATYNQSTWRQVQEKLNDSNFPVGTADGVNGPRTTEAIRNYQRSQNLDVTGRLNQDTLDAMGIEHDSRNNMNNSYSE